MNDLHHGYGDMMSLCSSLLILPCVPAPSAQRSLRWLMHVMTLCLLPAAAAQLDDVLVVGYGEWESRKALESHLQKGVHWCIPAPFWPEVRVP
jgi:hypothetical protein